jgi:periplasmic protein TonB
MQYMLREQSVGKNISRFGLVVGVHAILGVALIATLNRAPIVLNAPPPISVLNPKQPLKPTPPETPREIAKANLSTVQLVNVPIPDFVVDHPPIVDNIFATPTPTPTPTAQPDFRDSSPSTTDGTSSTPIASNLGIACPNATQVQGNMRYPAQAVREGIEGDVIVRFVVAGGGEIKNIAIASSSNRIFNNVVTQAVQQFGCRGQGQNVVVEAPFTFRLK